MLINCDMGESYGAFKVGNDDAIFPYIDMCNIACGFHGGDPLVIENCIKSAIYHGVKIGAHPSFPDLQGFGRRKMNIPTEELCVIVKYQVAALKGMVEAHGEQLFHMKPHGALYHAMNEDIELSRKLIEAILNIQKDITLVGFAGSHLERISKSMGVSFLGEAFADRTYLSSRKLAPRNMENAIIEKPLHAKEQVRQIMENQKVKTLEQTWIPIEAQTVCIHGDHPNAVEIAKAIQTLQ